MTFFETIQALLVNMGKSSFAGFIGVTCIFLYFFWIVYRAVKQIKAFASEDHTTH